VVPAACASLRLQMARRPCRTESLQMCQMFCFVCNASSDWSGAMTHDRGRHLAVRSFFASPAWTSLKSDRWTRGRLN
jgi:hypothetical protein